MAGKHNLELHAKSLDTPGLHHAFILETLILALAQPYWSWFDYGNPLLAYLH